MTRKEKFIERAKEPRIKTGSAVKRWNPFTESLDNVLKRIPNNKPYDIM